MPNWEPNNLTRHYRKRLQRDPGCFESLLGIAGGVMTEVDYDFRTEAAHDHAWGEYEGEGWDVQNREYSELRAYFVDDDLVVAITDDFRNEFVTCYHEHFDHPHGVVPGPGVTAGQKRLRYREKLKLDKQAGLIRKLETIRGF